MGALGTIGAGYTPPAIASLLGPGNDVLLDGGSVRTYTLPSSLILSGVDGMTLRGPVEDPAVITITNRTSQAIVRCTSDNVTFQNLRIVGLNDYRDDQGYTSLQNGVYEGNHGINVADCAGATIDNVQVDSVYGDGVYIGGSTPSTNITITDLSVTSCGRHGIGAVFCDGLSVDGFTLVKGGTAGVDLEPNAVGDYVRNVTISNFDIDPRTVPFAAAGSREVSDVVIENGVVRNGLVSWPLVAVERKDGGRGANWTVRNVSHTYTLASRKCLQFINVDDITVDGCSFLTGSYSLRTGGVRLVNCGGTVTLTDNDFDTMPARDYQEGAMSPTIIASGNTWAGGSD